MYVINEAIELTWILPATSDATEQALGYTINMIGPEGVCTEGLTYTKVNPSADIEGQLLIDYTFLIPGVFVFSITITETSGCRTLHTSNILIVEHDPEYYGGAIDYPEI